MDVSIIIVNYNTKELVKQCIESIKFHTKGIEYEIIVVDNSSKDGSVEYLENCNDIRLISLSENIGFGKANNEGVKHALGTYVFLLNSDTILLNNAVKIFFDYFNNHNEDSLGAIGTTLIDNDGDIIHSAQKFPSMFGIMKRYILEYLKRLKLSKRQNMDEKYDFLEKDSVKVDYITGADIFMKKETYDTLGGFHKTFFMYYEETELQKRMEAKGLERRIIHGPKIIHLIGKSFGKLPTNRQRIEQSKSMLKYFKLHNSYITLFIFKTTMFLLLLPIMFDKRYKRTENINFLSVFLKRTKI